MYGVPTTSYLKKTFIITYNPCRPFCLTPILLFGVNAVEHWYLSSCNNILPKWCQCDVKLFVPSEYCHINFIVDVFLLFNSLFEPNLSLEFFYDTWTLLDILNNFIMYCLNQTFSIVCVLYMLSMPHKYVFIPINGIFVND